ncbi:transcriptional regulator [Synechococcus sp. RSCCF101]|uniref:winged helix-turn-helix transcriptional regulator n=1 Tax=Synechococcus sp. RSCCF101 TaxID=2511069 RepID=UPI0012451D8B|nr:helix-turn-helix domain-containing protein [Synechococcus sp. RSCCF101]QEY33041.1 transcriptional regulator [Synechococcus sp. RSCCF101]
MAESDSFLNSHRHDDCPAELALQVMRGRWKVQILRELADGIQRFSALRRALNGVSEKVLASQLRDLEQAGVVHRRVYPEVPPKVEYSLTAKGCDLIPVLESLHAWGTAEQA